MKTYSIGILGATGAVGREMMKILSERGFPVGNIRLFASERSAGKIMTFMGNEVTLENADGADFSGLDFVLGAVSSYLAKKFAPKIISSGAVFIDNSSAFRSDERVPLVIPEINPTDALSHSGIISNPNCSTIITLVAANAICRLSPIKAMIVSTYQAVSGAGEGGIRELAEQQASLAGGEPTFCRVFSHRIAENLIPFIGSLLSDGYTTEELKSLSVTCTCVRVPVVRSHSVSVSVFTEEKITVEQAKKAFSSSDGCRLCDGEDYPMPLYASGGDTVLVGRVREDFTRENGIAFFCCGDQLRKGAATNAVQIAELLSL